VEFAGWRSAGRVGLCHFFSTEEMHSFCPAKNSPVLMGLLPVSLCIEFPALISLDFTKQKSTGSYRNSQI